MRLGCNARSLPKGSPQRLLRRSRFNNFRGGAARASDDGIQQGLGFGRILGLAVVPAGVGQQRHAIRLFPGVEGNSRLVCGDFFKLKGVLIAVGLEKSALLAILFALKLWIVP